MGIRLRSAIAVGGPEINAGGWFDFGNPFKFAAFTNSTTESVIPIDIIEVNTSSSVSGQNGLPAGQPIHRLSGAQIAFMNSGTSGGLAASTISRLGIAIYRSFGTVSTALTNAGAITSVAVAGGVNTALPSGQTFTITSAAGATPQVYTTSAAVAVGATSIPVNSITPSTTYAVGTPMVGQVGNAIAFGWLSTGDGATGTPAFRQNFAALMPAMSATANTALNTTGDPYGSFLQLYPGDIPCLYGITDSSTLSVPTGIVRLMGV